MKTGLYLGNTPIGKIIVSSVAGGVTGGTAKANQILAPETAYVNGEKIIGTMKNNGIITSMIDGIEIKSANIPEGYTAGGSVSLTNDIDNEVETQTDLLIQIQEALEGKSINGGDTSDANATSSDMREGTSGYVNGVKIEGDVPTRSAVDVIVGDTSVTIPAGIYDEIIEKAISNNGADGFEWHQLDFSSTYAADPAETYSFSIELEDDTFAIILRQTYSPTTRCVLIYGSDYTFNTLQNAMYIETISPMPQLSVSNMTIEDGVLYGTYSGVNFVEYALIPLNSKSGNSDTSTYETWVFTLEDGSTVEKEVEVGA